MCLWGCLARNDSVVKPSVISTIHACDPRTVDRNFEERWACGAHAAQLPRCRPARRRDRSSHCQLPVVPVHRFRDSTWGAPETAGLDRKERQRDSSADGRGRVRVRRVSRTSCGATHTGMHTSSRGPAQDHHAGANGGRGGQSRTSTDREHRCGGVIVRVVPHVRDRARPSSDGSRIGP